jgi:hypothetical protein
VFSLGTASLEEALIGKTKRKGGNLGRRLGAKYERMWLALLVASVRASHPKFSQMEAAEWILKHYPISLDADTLLRKCRAGRALKAATEIVRRAPHDVEQAAAMALKFQPRKIGKNKRLINPSKQIT